jgi:hypothetical protein
MSKKRLELILIAVVILLHHYNHCRHSTTTI